MKIGRVEGTPEEIRGLLENTGSTIADYLERPEPPLDKKWLLTPAVLLIVFIGLLVWAAPSSKQWATSLFLAGFGIGVWLVAAVQLRYNRAGVTSVIAFGVLLLLLLGAGYILPKETIDALKSIKN